MGSSILDLDGIHYHFIVSKIKKLCLDIKRRSWTACQCYEEYLQVQCGVHLRAVQKDIQLFWLYYLGSTRCEFNT